jgi:hypothetical protein
MHGYGTVGPSSWHAWSAIVYDDSPSLSGHTGPGCFFGCFERKESMAASGKLATLLQQYGKVGIGVHVLTSTAYFGCLFVGVRNGVDVPAVLSSLGFESLSARAESAEGWSDLAFAYAGSFSPFPSLVCRLRRAARPSNPHAFGRPADVRASNCRYKVITPIRWPTTIFLTPVVARLLNVQPRLADSDSAR